MYRTNERGNPLEVNFRNQNQVVLYENELKGQISDGHWENSSPMDHWEMPCDATAKVGKILGKNWLNGSRGRPQRGYSFASTDLVDVVGDRMRLYVKFSKAYPRAKIDTIDLIDSDINPDTGFYTEAPHHTKDEYWIKGIRKLLQVTHEKNVADVGKKIATVTYTHKDLMKDLRDMSKIFKLHVSQKVKNNTEVEEIPAPLTEDEIAEQLEFEF